MTDFLILNRSIILYVTLCYDVIVLSIVELPICSLNIIQLLFDLILRARCYDDWVCCSFIGSLLQTCPNYCKSLKGLHYSGGTCVTPTSVDCPCIPPGIKRCNC